MKKENKSKVIKQEESIKSNETEKEKSMRMIDILNYDLDYLEKKDRLRRISHDFEIIGKDFMKKISYILADCCIAKNMIDVGYYHGYESEYIIDNYYWDIYINNKSVFEKIYTVLSKTIYISERIRENLMYFVIDSNVDCAFTDFKGYDEMKKCLVLYDSLIHKVELLSEEMTKLDNEEQNGPSSMYFAFYDKIKDTLPVHTTDRLLEIIHEIYDDIKKIIYQHDINKEKSSWRF